MEEMNLPLIAVSATDNDRRSRIATAGVRNQRYAAAEMPADELDRAMIPAPGAIRPDIVTMHSEVECQGDGPEQRQRRGTMKSKNKSQIARKSCNHRPAEAKAVVVPEWAPQPNPLTREEIRKLVIDQIG